ncbi:MAG: hypothetical protein FJ308_09955 [Planctomycetes bacterium]|nr:hypothetical protein [Planctomycetota bacterium]
MNEDAITDYASAILQAGGWPFPPIKVVRHVLVDGFHRIEASRRVIADGETPAELRKSLQSIPCERVEVDQANHDITELALQHALAANQTHGLRRTQADKRRSVEVAIERWPNESDRQIAKLTGTTHPFVAKVRRELNVETLPVESMPSSLPEESLGGVETLPAALEAVSAAEALREVETLPLLEQPASVGDGKKSGNAVIKKNYRPELTPEETAAMTKKLVHQHRDKLVMAIDDYAACKPNRSEQNRLVRLVQSVSLW